MCKRNEQPKWPRQALTKTVCRNSVIPPESEVDSLVIQIQLAIIDKQKAINAELQATLDRLEKEADQQQVILAELQTTLDRLQKEAHQLLLQLAKREKRRRQAQKTKRQRMQKMINCINRDRRRDARRYARLRARFWPRGRQM